MKDKFIKLTSGILSASLFLESCGNSAFIECSADEFNQIFVGTNFETIAIPIKTQVSDRDIEYVEFLQNLALDILKNPAIAQEFIDDPTLYIQKNGFSINLGSIDPKLTQLILALADPDICDVIESQDVKQYLHIMKSKGLIDDIVIKDLDVLDNINVTQNGDVEASALFFPAVVVGVALAIWAVAVEYVFAGNAVAVGTVFSYLAAININTLGQQTHRLYEKVLQSTPIEIFSIKSLNDVDGKIIADAYIEQSVDSTLLYLAEKYPAELAKYDERILRNAIILNIQKAIYE